MIKREIEDSTAYNSSNSSSNSAISFDKSAANNESSSYTSAGSERPSFVRKRSSSLNKIDPSTLAHHFHESDESNNEAVNSPSSSSSSSCSDSTKTRRHTFSGDSKNPLVIELSHPIVQPSISNLINQDSQQQPHHTPASQNQFNKSLPAEPLPQMPAPLPTPTYRKYHKPHGHSTEQPPEFIPFTSSSLQLPSLQNWSLDHAAPSRKSLSKKRKISSDMDNHESHTTTQALAASQQDNEYANSQLRKLDNGTSETSNNATASTHTPSTTSKGKIYTCHYCFKTFNRPSSLKIHTYSHTGERPFVCQVSGCNRSFSVASNLKRHAKVHNNTPQHNPAPTQTHNNVSQQHTNKITNVHTPTLTKEPSPMELTLSQGDGQISSGSNGSQSASSGDSKQNSGGAGEYADMEDNSSSGNEKKRDYEDESVMLAQNVNSRKNGRRMSESEGGVQSVPSLQRTSQLIDGKLKSTMRVPQTRDSNQKRMINALNNGRSISIDGKSLSHQFANRSIDENGTIISTKFQNQDRQASVKEDEKQKQQQDDYDSSNEIYSSPNEDEDADELPIKKKILY